MRELTYDGQYGIPGSVVNVLSNVDKTQRVLPHFLQDEASIVVGIKQKIEYKHCYMSGLVRPLLTMKAMEVLVQTSLYKQENILINTSWLCHIYFLKSSSIPIVESHNKELLCKDNHTGVLLHGIENPQQIMDYTDKIVYIAPSKGNHPLGLFSDTYGEGLSFPTIFYGEPRTYHDLNHKHYQTIAKWEIQHNDRQFALNLENLF